MSLKPGDKIKLTIHDLAFGGEGVGRIEDFVVFVPFVIVANHLNKCVKTTTGQSAQDLLNEMIVLEAKVLLKQTDMQISEIAYKLSQQNHSDFSRFFKAKTGMSPKEYKQKD